MWRQPFANSSRSHCLDDSPSPAAVVRRILKILRLHFEQPTGLLASATRYLEIESVTRGLPDYPHAAKRLRTAVSPCNTFCITGNWDS